ncbi:hypothetical protein [Aequorivita vladivostokensis]|uniref:Curlin n=1 Tax=Aequorivita vladivostokensis TaxID=171194 RepID=A0ABR5DHL6_9FLAO|nr:hypothetical protein [Aequorivita vladivostokensis]KJJ38290.1 hypothetical protein MB09_09555 [Aequorivita vladivostokensis]
MKKVILGAAALMIGAIGFAQYTPDAPGAAGTIGNNSSSSTANTGESIQNGDNQKVKVRQVGTEQSAASYQDNGAGIGSNQAFIKQIGSVTGTSGYLNRAEVHQKGSTNESTQLQEGDNNSSLVNQGMTDMASADNKVWARQGTNEQAENNSLEVNQDGDRNESRTLQTYDNSEALVNQMGDDNAADIKQRAFSNGTEGHAAEVNQDGDRNQALIDQTGLGARNEATTIQFGDDNSSYQIQVATSSTAGEGNNALVTQGDGSTTTQIETDLWTNGLLTVDDIDNGSFNPGSDGSIARQEQYGTNNAVEAQQFGEDNQSYQIQGNFLSGSSDGNRALVVQNAYGSPAGGGNNAAQVQLGDDNDAAIGQNGNDHTALQVQIGADNVAMSTQRGQNNNANVWQFGNDSWATTAQRGECNNAFITQYDGQSYSVEQNLADGMPFGHNQADILQQGPNGTQVDGLYECDLPDVDPGTYSPIGDLGLTDICPGC